MNAPLTAPKHIDFVGYVVFVDATMLDPDIAGWVPMPVRAVNFEEGTDYGCDFCNGPSVAVYDVDAQSALGPDGGHDTAYCQDCASTAAMASKIGQSPDRWVHPDNLNLPEWREVLEKWNVKV